MKVVSGLKILYICQSVRWQARRLEMKFMEIVEASSASFSPFNTLVFTENKKKKMGKNKRAFLFQRAFVL